MTKKSLTPAQIAALAIAALGTCEVALATAHTTAAGDPFGDDGFIQEMVGLLGQPGSAAYDYFKGMDFQLAGSGATCRYEQSFGGISRQVYVKTNGTACERAAARIEFIEGTENLISLTISPVDEMQRVRDVMGPESECRQQPGNNAAACQWNASASVPAVETFSAEFRNIIGAMSSRKYKLTASASAPGAAPAAPVLADDNASGVSSPEEFDPFPDRCPSAGTTDAGRERARICQFATNPQRYFRGKTPNMNYFGCAYTDLKGAETAAQADAVKKACQAAYGPPTS
ncbi:MAG: hypothetical protein QNJ73_09705 [Gammaproteobacteria bacterium]|nr:hypothetical protein [Gammaproteobacteria bacterium]